MVWALSVHIRHCEELLTNRIKQNIQEPSEVLLFPFYISVNYDLVRLGTYLDHTARKWKSQEAKSVSDPQLGFSKYLQNEYIKF